MARLATALVGVVLLALILPTGAGGTAGLTRAADEPDGNVRIAGVYPNPVAEDDRGEFVLLEVPTRRPLGAYRVHDGDDWLALENVSAAGQVAVTSDPAAVRNLTEFTVVAATGETALANGGERLRLVRGNRTVDRARYRETTEGKLGRFDERGAITWEPLGTTDRPVVSAAGGHVGAFVLPDSPAIPAAVMRRADRRILLAGYTFGSDRVTRLLENASRRGVDVHVLLEGEPVDGITTHQARLLDRLVAAGVEVDLLGGPYSRYAYHHAKYVVADDHAVVLTENWKPAGTGGASSRGWGVVVEQPPIVEGLVETFRADADWRGAIPWESARMGRTFREAPSANGSYPRQHLPTRVPVERTRLFVAPDNAGDAVVDVLDNATESIDVIQMTIDGPDGRFIRAARRAARRGVQVRILLSGAWYIEQDNRRLVGRLRETAARENLPLQAKLATSGEAFEKIHAKGVIVDRDQVLLGSLNWNRESIRKNREVVLSLAGDRVGAYYSAVFAADWAGPAETAWSVPVGLVAAVLGCVVLAVLVAMRLEVGERVGVGP